MRSLLQKLLDSLCAWIEPQPKPHELQNALVEIRRRLTTQVLHQPNCDPRIVEDCAAVASWLDPTTDSWQQTVSSTPQQRRTRDSEGSFSEAQRWWHALPDQRVLQKGVLQPGAGRHLHTLLQHGSADLERAIAPQLETLLRHVEVTRDQALSRFPMPLSAEELWLERLDVTLLFIRRASHARDVRFLNAALKLNDYAFLSRQTRKSPVVAARLMRSLAEQEALMQEWSPRCVLPFSPPSKAVSIRAS